MKFITPDDRHSPRRTGIEYDIRPVIRIIMENELKMKNITLTRMK